MGGAAQKYNLRHKGLPDSVAAPHFSATVIGAAFATSDTPSLRGHWRREPRSHELDKFCERVTRFQAEDQPGLPMVTFYVPRK